MRLVNRALRIIKMTTIAISAKQATAPTTEPATTLAEAAEFELDDGDAAVNANDA